MQAINLFVNDNSEASEMVNIAFENAIRFQPVNMVCGNEDIANTVSASVNLRSNIKGGDKYIKYINISFGSEYQQQAEEELLNNSVLIKQEILNEIFNVEYPEFKNAFIESVVNWDITVSFNELNSFLETVVFQLLVRDNIDSNSLSGMCELIFRDTYPLEVEDYETRLKLFGVLMNILLTEYKELFSFDKSHDRHGVIKGSFNTTETINTLIEMFNETKFIKPSLFYKKLDRKDKSSSIYTTSVQSKKLNKNLDNVEDINFNFLDVINSTRFAINTSIIDYVNVDDLIEHKSKYSDKDDEDLAEYKKNVDELMQSNQVYDGRLANGFHLNHFFDGSNRFYCQGYVINYQGSEVHKAMVRLNKQENIVDTLQDVLNDIK